MMNEQIPELSVILPCRNEEEAIEGCLQKINTVLASRRLNAEIIVSDSSTDSSPSLPAGTT